MSHGTTEVHRLYRLAALFFSAWLTLSGARWALAGKSASPYDVVGGGRAAAAVSLDYSARKAALAAGAEESGSGWKWGNAGPRPTETVLILTPMKNAIEHIWNTFRLYDTLTYPRHLIHLGFLVSDSTDGTWERLHELAEERQKRAGRGKRYGRISMFRKDFLADGEGPDAPDLENKGAARHGFGVQIIRRTLLAKSRSWLLSATLAPEVDWVLWVDVDVDEYAPTLVQDLIAASRSETAPIVAPNCMWRTYDDIGPYDRNNWWETPESEALKATLKPDDILVEGYKDVLDTHRLLLGESYDYKSKEAAARQPKSVPLDGVGGCCLLVDATVHREGAVFPAYAFDHQIETEGFAQMAKRLGKKIVGLPTYHVYHGLYG